MKIILLSALIALNGCATALTPKAEEINIVNGDQKAKCTRIKLITSQVTLGPNKPANAFNGALNQAAEVGADSFYIISSTSHAFDGESVIGEALRCK